MHSVTSQRSSPTFEHFAETVVVIYHRCGLQAWPLCRAVRCRCDGAQRGGNNSQTGGARTGGDGKCGLGGRLWAAGISPHSSPSQVSHVLMLCMHFGIPRMTTVRAPRLGSTCEGCKC